MRVYIKCAITRFIFSLVVIFACTYHNQLVAGVPRYEYRLLVYDIFKVQEDISQMQKEIDQSAAGGLRVAFMTLGTARVGGEVFVIMVKDLQQDSKPYFQYRFLIAPNSPAGEKKMNQASAEGFQYKMSVLPIILMEKDLSTSVLKENLEFKMITTSRLATIRKEIIAAAETGFRVEDIYEPPNLEYGAILSRPKGANKARYEYKLLDILPKLSDDGFIWKSIIINFWSPGSYAYLMEKDLNSAPEKIEYRLINFPGPENAYNGYFKLEMSRRNGFRCLAGKYRGKLNVRVADDTSVQLLMAKSEIMSGKWDFEYLRDDRYFETKQTGHLLKLLTHWANHGYELIAFSPKEAVLIRPQGSEEESATVAAGLPLRDLGIEFVTIPAGSFQMGSKKANSDKKPVYEVTISRGFELGKYEVTQGQWKAVMGYNPSEFENCGDNCPVENVSWMDIQKFLNLLNARKDGHIYRLPTEAEWEYAAQAGATGDYGAMGKLDEIAWYNKNSGKRTHPVGQKKPNAWGLYDMSGNVMEWVQDLFGNYPSGAVTDATGPLAGSFRVVRGGSWIDSAGNCQSVYRNGFTPFTFGNNLGFRLRRTQ